MDKQQVIAELQKKYEEAIKAQEKCPVGFDMWRMYETRAIAFANAISIVLHLKEAAE